MADFIAFFLITGIIIMMYGVGICQRKKELAKLYREADELFNKTKFTTNDARFDFDGETSQVIHDSVETHGISHTYYYLTRYALSENGEYFTFMSNDGKPIVKHIDHTKAKAILKSKYIEPNKSKQRTAQAPPAV